MSKSHNVAVVEFMKGTGYIFYFITLDKHFNTDQICIILEETLLFVIWVRVFLTKEIKPLLYGLLLSQVSYKKIYFKS